MHLQQPAPIRSPGLRRAWLCAAALALVWQGAVAQTCARLVATGNPEYPPYLWRESERSNRMAGANAELMRLLSKEIGIPIEVRYAGTWARVQEEARQGRVDLIAGAFFTQPRQAYMDYVQPAFQQTRSMVWKRQDGALQYQRWDDLQGRSGVTVINNSFGEEFDRYAKDKLRIDAVPSLEQALRMVEHGRADYLVYEEGPAQAYIARLGVQGLVAQSPPVSNEGLYLTMSRKSPCSSDELRARLARAMAQFDQQNVMKKLVEDGVAAWRMRH